MAILDPITPVYYQVLRMGIQQTETDVIAMYDVAIRNATGDRLAILNPDSTLTEEERQVIRDIFVRDKQQFEAATGLPEWTPEE